MNGSTVNPGRFLGEFEVDSQHISQMRAEELIESFDDTLVPITQDTSGIFEYYAGGPSQDLVKYDYTLWFRFRRNLPVKMIIVYCGVNLNIEVIHDLILQALSIGGDAITKIMLAGSSEELVSMNQNRGPSH